jgi:hypothetical protein
LASVSVAQAPISQLKDEISTRIDALRPELERIGRDIHANPEIAYEEHKAVAWLSELLKNKASASSSGSPTRRPPSLPAGGMGRARRLRSYPSTTRSAAWATAAATT